ncbi:3-hydroxyacyl-CoA dehydrogenase NAD-binding domain-containing protein [Martelella soudanensis]|uniref:3-hydroxyacyl-CoA dehydrogenase NAD-binding domain-containing protein n=1 Tax=unclassified Martelella TaxID=2629616 RepID=UPI001FF0139F|nr:MULTISPECIES: 3-hydroxyacyl-CoA dehydrogenase NAD-binding domain-containing protein [unclassified Martelella]
MPILESDMNVMTIDRRGSVAVVTIDNPPVNALSNAVRAALVSAVETLDGDDQVKAVVLSCAGRTFIAGADVREFNLPPQEPHLPDVVAAIEDAKKPWVAAIHGSALGGGFEIALGCRFRIADAMASVGLPEVTLGLIPGASGTVRTPRVAGVETAVKLVVSGRPMKAKAALAAGLVDAIAERDLVEEAVSFAERIPEKALPLKSRERAVAAPAEDFWAAAEKDARKPGYRAPQEALASVRFAVENPFDVAMRHEREKFLELRASKEAAALRHVFFAERAASRPESLKGIEPVALSSVGVIGGGTMGAGIAAAVLNAGLSVTLIERDEEAVARGLRTIDGILAGSVKRGKLTEAGQAALMMSLGGVTDYGALSDCDLVIEAVFEEISVKRAVFEKLGEVCRANAVLATNTSYLDPRLIAEGLAHPERFIGLHFFSPAHVMKLLEIVPTPETSQTVLATAFAFAKRLGKVPVRAGICEGFIGNRILKRYRAAAEELVGQGVAIADIDAAMRGYGFKMGPFEAQDLGGLDIAFLQREGARANGENVPEALGDILVRAGRKGHKTGGGWYDYAPGNRKPIISETVHALLKSRIAGHAALSADEIAARLVGAMAGEGRAILAEGIAEKPADIDLVEIHGYGFPRHRGGPMFAEGG